MSVITVLRVQGTHTFPFVNPERFLTTHSEGGKRYDHYGSSWKNTLVNIQDAGKAWLQELTYITYKSRGAVSS
ncbi:MAG: hypothetical protein V1766_04890 [Pseudomonadota bacterium]